MAATAGGLTRRFGAGLLFGAALTASGVYAPSVIVGQMELTEWHMLTVFMCASAASAAIMSTFEKLNIVARQPRKNSSYGWFGAYDANVVGGLLQGVGMTCTGACPGTVLVQLVMGVRSGVWAALGGLIGGILYAGGLGEMIKRKSKSMTAREPVIKEHTIQAKFHVDPDKLLLAYEAMCLGVIGASVLFGLDDDSPWLHPILGGAFIGGGQAASLLLTGNPVGVSSAYEEAGRWFWKLLPSGHAEASKDNSKIPVTGMTFAAGLMAGSFTLAQYTPSGLADGINVSPMSSLIGGCAMIFGARIAGGCTSGHGISGMAMFSISSVITVAAMFGGGIATALLF